jgi:tRNA U55 pseudouridine synthase TruB
MPSKHDPEGRRQLAKDAGHATYDTGVPCKNGHKSPRYTATTTCAECKKDTFAKAYAKDKNRRLGYAAKWRDLNRDAVNLYAKEYREKFPEKVHDLEKIHNELNYLNLRGSKLILEMVKRYMAFVLGFYLFFALAFQLLHL